MSKRHKSMVLLNVQVVTGKVITVLVVMAQELEHMVNVEEKYIY